jgi:hypothetical protein
VQQQQLLGVAHRHPEEYLIRSSKSQHFARSLVESIYTLSPITEVNMPELDCCRAI